MIVMMPAASKLKRSPYLSEMTRTSEMKMTAMPSLRPGGAGSNGVKVEGFDWDFFELKRPPLTTSQREQHSSGLNRPSEILPSVVEAQAGDMRKDASSVNTQSSIDDQMSLNGPTRTHTGNQLPSSFNDFDKSRVISPYPYHDESSQRSSKKALQFKYKPGMKSTASLLLKRRSARVMSFREMLDEGDGKEGDLNVRLRNEQWKTFMDRRKLPRHLHHCRRKHGEQDISATELAVLRQAACRRKMHWVKSTVKSGDELVDLMPSILSQAQNEFMIRPSSSQFISVDCAKIDLEKISMPSLKQRRSAVSAGLAYGSDVFRMLKNETVEV